MIDETGVSLDGHQTAHVSRQYLANLGKIDNGVVSVRSLWADERVYYPVEVEPYTPAQYEASGKQDPAFRTKLVIARQLVERARQQALPFRAAVADSFYGEDRTLRRELRSLGVPYVLALKPSHAWWHPEEVAGTLQDVAHEAGWVSAEQPGKWLRITRTFRDGSTQDWWVVEIVAGTYGPDKTERAIVATTDPESLPNLSTWYLVTNLPAPTERPGPEPPFLPASLEEVIRLYGLRSKLGSTLGGSTFAYLSTGEQIDNPRFFREEEHALARTQRTFSKEQKSTPEWERRRKVVAWVHEGVRWRREDFIRQQVACLIKRFGLIAVEALVVRNLVKNPKLAKSIADVAWSSFFAHLLELCGRSWPRSRAGEPGLHIANLPVGIDKRCRSPCRSINAPLVVSSWIETTRAVKTSLQKL